MKSHFNNQYHAEISPIKSDTFRPLWSVLIPTHNCAEYLKETLASVLNQDPGPEKMEIIVVDDHSTADDPHAAVKQISDDRVRFVQQPDNVGKVRNYETGLQMSRGHLIHQLHGDDKVRPGFYDKMGKLMAEHPEAGAGFCRSIYIDENSDWIKLTGSEQENDGIVNGFLERIAVGQRVQTPAMVVRRSVYEDLCGFDRRLDCMEDWEMWTRIANFYPVAFCNKVLTEYRVHDTNATNKTLLDGSALKTQRCLLKIVDGYLDQNVLKRIVKQRARKQADFLLFSATAMKRRNGEGKTIAHRTICQALKYSRKPKVLLNSARLFLKK